MIGTDAFFNDGTVAPIAGVVVNKCKPYRKQVLEQREKGY